LQSLEKHATSGAIECPKRGQAGQNFLAAK